ncbi:hypothetical protein PTTG_27118 [Puccinia triticina 1-1 BBBD Race 1]|uniref:Uncharacterized protein n=1 Tax=Puccinia triticina (isolate 1-1 / race 1 (BBBD)) TaxID=630390 RepID=A0A180GNK8_PUCT1|nr:hypothetical protein PTTG_27118 [Puccinia triticina 1-1 BBBD Race 1]
MVRGTLNDDDLHIYYSTTTPINDSENVRYRCLNWQAVITALDKETGGAEAIEELKLDSIIWLVVDETSETLEKLYMHWLYWETGIAICGSQTSEILDLINKVCTQ